MKEYTGNIFNTECQTIVNTVNCEGVMGAGIAYECRLRYPEMYTEYVNLCNENKMCIGKLWLYNKSPEKWILNFPTKIRWRDDSKREYLEKGLQKFLDTYKQKGITSIAFPLLGASKGGLPEQESLSIMHSYLSRCDYDIDIEIWHFDPKASDELFETFKQNWLKADDEMLAKISGISIGRVRKLKEGLTSDNIYRMSGLLQIKGIGEDTLEKAFQFTRQMPIVDTSVLFS
jgi:O-acetyl-ADP-ribose deacetylase (regulator of RNase III)